MLKLFRSTVHNPHTDESRPAESAASDLKGFPKTTSTASPQKMLLRIPKSPLTVVGDPDQASSVPLAGHVEVLAKPSQQAEISSIQLTLVRTTKIKKAASKPQESLLASRRRSFGSRSPTRDKRTHVEELMQWTIAYSPCHMTEDTTAASSPDSRQTKQTDRRSLIPFHIQIPGHLPATTSTALGSTSYTLTASAISTTSSNKILFKTETPLTIARALHLPAGPATVVLRRRFPESAMSTRLTLPGVLSPTASFTATLTLCGSVTRRGRTTSHLCVRRVDWRIEERASVVSASDAPHHRLPLFSELEAGSVGDGAQRPKDGQTHVRKLAAGKWDGGWMGNVDTLPRAPTTDGEVDVSFPIALPASAKAACSVEAGAGGAAAAAAAAAPRHGGGPEDAPLLAVRHVLVLELITVELKYNADTGALVNMYPFPQRKFGAVYDLNVAHWDYGGGDGGGATEMVQQQQQQQQQTTPMIAIPPCAELLGEMPPSYDSVAVM